MLAQEPRTDGKRTQNNKPRTMNNESRIEIEIEIESRIDIVDKVK